MARGKLREMKKTKVEIIPMIDTMFFLLVFFILSSLGIVKLQGININLPESGTPPPPSAIHPKTVEIVIRIDAKGDVFVNNKPAGRHADIGPMLQREMVKGLGQNYDVKNASVIINADPIATHGTVVTCIDQARAVDITNFAIAAHEDEMAGAASGTIAPNAASPKP